MTFVNRLGEKTYHYGNHGNDDKQDNAKVEVVYFRYKYVSMILFPARRRWAIAKLPDKSNHTNRQPNH